MSNTSQEDYGQALNSLLRHTQATPSGPFLPEELSYLITAFLPSQSTTLHSKAYLVLSAFCQGVRKSFHVTGKHPDPATESLTRIFSPPVISRIRDTDESTLLEGISFLTALFQVDWEAASSVFLQDGLIDIVMDSVDLTPSPELSLHVAHLLSQASGHKPCRAIVSSKSMQWLEANSRQTTDTALRAAAAIGLVKLSRGTSADTAETTGSGVQDDVGRDEELAKVMKGMLINEENKSSTTDAVEGLAYLSVDPAVKEALSQDSAFLARLFSLVPRRKVKSSLNSTEADSSLLYGILVIVSNICAYPPHLTEEQAQIEKLKRMANAGKGASRDDLLKLEDDQHIKKRVRRLVRAGVLDVLAAAVSGTDSPGIRFNASKALLSIIEDKDNRGKVLQSGGAKTLMLIIKHATSNSASSTKNPMPDADVLQPIQALAKLAITSSPLQVFGPNTGAVFDAIRPLSILLLHPSAALLQRFEAIMALTNLSSQSPESASRIAKVEGLMNRVELLLLEEHELIRRASMELICNLIAGSDEIFERYGGTENPAMAKSKLQVLLALSDVEDLPTRLAASGALATLTAAPSACQMLLSLQLERQRVLPILTQLIDPSVAPQPIDADETEEETAASSLESDPGLIHRGVIIARNFLLSIEADDDRRNISTEADKMGLSRALVKILKGELGGVNEVLLRPAAEALKFLMDAKA